MLNNVMLVSAVQQSASAICLHMTPPFWIFFLLAHHRTLSRVPCATQYVFINYLVYISPQLVSVCQSRSPNSSPPPPPLLLLDIHRFVLYVCVSISAL